MKNFKSMLALLLAMILVVGCLPLSAFAATGYQNAYGFVDFPTGWSEAAMKNAVENGLISGYGDGTVRPKYLLTRAEMAAIINRAFGAEVKADIAGKYSDVTPDKWYFDEMAKAVNMRTFSGYEDGTMHPENAITRQEAILVIARALVINSEDPHLLDNFTDKADIGDFAKGAIASFVLRGYIHGYEDSTIRPNNYITREEFAQIMDNIFAAYVRADGAVTVGNSEGEVILTGDNVHLYSSVIDGDLIIGDGVGATNVALENVVVKGRIVFRGGEGLVTLRNVTKDGLIVTNDPNGTVNFNHYSTEGYFKNAVYNTTASFLDRTVAGGTASGTGLGNHDTHVDGRVDAETGEEKKPEPGVINPTKPGTGGGTVTKYYDITLDPANGDEEIVIEDIKQGLSLKQSGKTLPADPEKEGFWFGGWFYEQNGIERKLTINTAISADITAYAKWHPMVVFYEDDTFATQFGEAYKVEIGSTLGGKFPTETPTKDGYIFVKWMYDDSNGAAEFTKDTVINEYTKVYATWEVVPPTIYTVTFYDNKGGNVFGTPIEVEEGKTIGDAFPTEIPVKDGFTFLGWISDDLVSGTTVVTKDTEIFGNTTVYPNWRENAVIPEEYTVTFYDGNGNVFGTPIVAEEGTALGDNFPTETPTKDGYTFVKWVYDTPAGPVEFTKNTIVTDDMVIYPVWEEEIVPPTEYTVTFYDGNGNVFGTPIVAEEGTSLGDNFPTETPTKDGYTFVKWVYDSGEGTLEFTKATIVTSDMTIYPEWEEEIVPPTEYTVTFYDGNGNVFGTPITVEEGTSLDEEFPQTTPTKDGYTFVKWVYDSGEGTLEFTKATIVTSDMTIYPEWEEEIVPPTEYTVTFYDGNGNVFGTPITVEEGTSLDEEFPQTTPTKDGYTFVKWVYDSGEGTLEFTKATIVTSDMTIYPEWEEEIVPPTEYTVTFYDGNGNVFGTPITVEEGTSLGDNFPTETPTKDGYTFVKWVYESNEGTVEFTKDTVVDADISVYPEWEEDVVPPTTYTVTFLTEKDGSVFATVTDIEEGTAIGENFPVMVPQKPGYEFTGWVYEAEGIFTDVTPETIVNCDMTVYAVYNEVTEPVENFIVTFYEYGWLDVHTTEVESGATVPEEEISTAYALLADPVEKGYEANMDDESYISDSTEARVHEIEGTWYYLVDGKYEIFDETVVVESDLEVYYYFNTMYSLVSLESFFGPMGNYKFEAFFAQDTLAAESVLDLLWLNRSAFKTIIKTSTDPLLGKTVKVGDIIEYTPVNDKGEIMNIVYNYGLLGLLGESTVREYITDAVTDMVKNDEAVLRSAVHSKLEMASVPENVSSRKIVEEFVMSDAAVRAKFEAIAEKLIREEYPEYNDDVIEELVKQTMESHADRLDLIEAAFAEYDFRMEVEDVIINEVKSRIANDEDCEFTDHVVDIAEAAYDDEIETFMHQLKHEDAYLINTESDGTDRRFIINAVSKKLHNTTYEDIKKKLPSAITKLLDEEVMKEIFESTIAGYIAEVDAVKAAVWASDYDGKDYWVGSYVPVTVNPIDHVLIPYYDKAMAKLDSKLPGVEFYNANPYLAEIEALIHYNEVIDKVTAPSEGASGYSLKMDGDSLDTDAYFALLYKFAVLSYDAIDWTLTNVPEEKIDDTINVMADRLGGFYDKLSEKFSQLQSGKITNLRDKAYDYLAKAVAKDTSSVWGTVTPTFFDEKLDKVYDKGTKLILEKSGFDVTEALTVEIAEDFLSVTLTQGEKTVTKTVPDIAKDIEKAGHTVSVNGTVITVDGKIEVDVVDYAKKITNKFGSVFTGRFYEDEEEMALVPELLRAYVLELNSDYVKLQIRLK